MTIRIDGTNTAANPGITGTDTDTGLQFGTDEVNIVTGGSKRATVDSNGNLGIGTASIDSNTNYNTLEIVGDTSSGGGIVRLKTGDRTTAKTMLFCDTGGFEARVETNHPFVISTNNSERLRVLAGGGLTFNGDTAAANALDDYEEGVYAATLTCGSGSITLNTNIQNLAYTKIGRLVHVQGQIVVSSVSSPSGIVGLSLPFAQAVNLSQSADNAMIAIMVANAGIDADRWGLFLGSSTTMNIARVNRENPTATDAGQSFSGNESITVSFNYLTA